MAGRFLLDSTVVVALLRSNVAIEDRLAAAEEVYLPAVSLGELRFGAEISARSSENLDKVETFAAACVQLPIDSDTARLYGRLKVGLRRKGRLIPDNDLWIAACALQYGLTLATQDEHYLAIDGLALEMW